MTLDALEASSRGKFRPPTAKPESSKMCNLRRRSWSTGMLAHVPWCVALTDSGREDYPKNRDEEVGRDGRGRREPDGVSCHPWKEKRSGAGRRIRPCLRMLVPFGHLGDFGHVCNVWSSSGLLFSVGDSDSEEGQPPSFWKKVNSGALVGGSLNAGALGKNIVRCR